MGPSVEIRQQVHATALVLAQAQRALSALDRQNELSSAIMTSTLPNAQLNPLSSRHAPY